MQLLISSVEHLAEGALQIDRLGGGPDSGPALAADPALDRAEQARPPAGSGEDGEQEKGCGRLSVRSCNACNLEPPRRLAEEGVGRWRHRPAYVGNEELGHGEIERSLDDECRRASGDRLGREPVAVRLEAGDTEEEASGVGLPAVVDEGRDVDRRGAHRGRRADRVTQRLQLNGVGY